MKCELCENEDKLIKFYWGFFENEYDKTKWINICNNCSQRFIKASNIYTINRKPLIEMHQEIKNKVRKK